MNRLYTTILATILLAFSINASYALTRITTLSGKSFSVSASHAHKFRAFVHALERKGYKIDFIGGWRKHGSCRGCNMHPAGLAIDINQTARNRVTRRFPVGINQLARQHGLLHGAEWRHADAGHFEVLGVKQYRNHKHGKQRQHRTRSNSGTPDRNESPPG